MGELILMRVLTFWKSFDGHGAAGFGLSPVCDLPRTFDCWAGRTSVVGLAVVWWCEDVNSNFHIIENYYGGPRYGARRVGIDFSYFE